MLSLSIASILMASLAQPPQAISIGQTVVDAAEPWREGTLRPASDSLCESRHIYRGFLAEIEVGAPDAIGGHIFAVPTPVGELMVSVAPRSVRAEGFRIVTMTKPGVFEEIPLPPVVTVRGAVRNVPGARVAGMVVDGEATLVIDLPEGRRFCVEPGEGPHGLHLVYDAEDRVNLGATCGVGDAIGPNEGHAHNIGGRGAATRAGGKGGSTEAQEQPMHAHGDGNSHRHGGGDEGDGGVAGGVTRWAQVAVDADYPFFLEHGQNPISVAHRIEACFATANLQYDAQCNIEHLVTGILIRTTAAADPYNNDAACTDVFNQTGLNWDVQGQWQNNPPQPFARDAVMLFTGRSFVTVVGCAMENSICNTNIFAGAYGWVQANWAGINNLNASSDTLAHELGHMWNASHCTCTTPPTTMNPSILGSLTFSPGSVSQIMSHLSAHPSCFEVSTQPPIIGCGTGSAEQSCFAVHATPWCSNDQCCMSVCALDPFCCVSSWDSLCVQRAIASCGTCGVGTASCTAAHGTPGCWLSSCCGTVCLADPFCCDEMWDSFCVDRAVVDCGSTGESCSEAISIATNVPTSVVSGPIASDGNTCGTTGTRPRWYSWLAPSAGILTVRICGGELSTAAYSVAMFNTCGGPRISCEVDPVGSGVCVEGPGTVELLPVDQLESIRIRVAMLNQLPIPDGVLTLTFAPYPMCGLPSSGSCVLTHATSGCADGSCCAEVCAADPFCCSDFWDAVCVQGARSLCGYSPSDLDGDGTVGAADLALLLDNWGNSGAGDINGSGTVDAADLSLLLTDWGS